MSNPVCADCGCETVPAESDQMKWHECPKCEPRDDGIEWMKSDSQRAAEDLMMAAGQMILDGPGEPSKADRVLRAKLQLEETLELCEGLGVSVYIEIGSAVARVAVNRLQFTADGTFDLIAAVDGCCDTNVVTAGTLSAMGVPDLPVQAEVESSNRSKLLNDGTLPPHPTVEGKFGKGPNYHEPNIQRVLDSIFEQKIGGKA